MMGLGSRSVAMSTASELEKLLTVLADPEKYKAQLAELTAKVAEAQAAEASVDRARQALQTEADASRAAIAAERAAAQDETQRMRQQAGDELAEARRLADANRRTAADLAERERDLKGRAEALTNRAKQLQQAATIASDIAKG